MTKDAFTECRRCRAGAAVGQPVTRQATRGAGAAGGC